MGEKTFFLFSCFRVACFSLTPRYDGRTKGKQRNDQIYRSTINFVIAFILRLRFSMNLKNAKMIFVGSRIRRRRCRVADRRVVDVAAVAAVVDVVVLTRFFRLPCARVTCSWR